jgi:hypothetical protein
VQLSGRPFQLSLRGVELTYVLLVAAMTTVGFITASTWPFVVAALVTLPSSLVAVPAFYVGVGLLGLLPGANPAHGTGRASCTPLGHCEVSTTGDPAFWFLLATGVAGIVALTSAALLNVALLRVIAGRRAASSAASHR